MYLPEYIHPDFLNQFPSTMTVLVTYGCTAACEQCCFESNPSIKKRLSFEQITNAIQSAKNVFPALKLVVFSGGEAFMLKKDLVKSIRYANDLGLLTRVVTNAYWAKTPTQASKIVSEIKQAGINEINISTGLDHQRWVSEETVLNAVEALLEQDIFTLVTVELDSEESRCLEKLVSNPRLKRVNGNPNFSLISNSWMSFQEGAIQRKVLKDSEEVSLGKGCSQVFDNLVVTPHHNLSACCGLTLEHIPEVRLGNLDENNIWDLYQSQFSDFLKTWIHVDGPYTIMKKLLGDEGIRELGNMRHICEACAIMHKNPKVIKAITENYHHYIPEVLARMNAKISVNKLEFERNQKGALV